MTARLLELCEGLPVRELSDGEVLVGEGGRSEALYVVAAGTFDVTRQGERVAAITEPGAVIGEISMLLDTPHGATVTASAPANVYVIERPEDFIVTHPGALVEITKTLAQRLDRLVGYLADVKAQYAGAGGNLSMLDDVLSELTFGEQPVAEPGSARDPDPSY